MYFCTNFPSQSIISSQTLGAGGGQQLQQQQLNLLIPTPNGRDESGTSRDCFLLNPTLRSQHHVQMFRFLGLLMGIAIRTGSQRHNPVQSGSDSFLSHNRIGHICPRSEVLFFPWSDVMCGLFTNPNSFLGVSLDQGCGSAAL